MTKYVKYVCDLLPAVRGYPANFSLTEWEHMCDLHTCFHKSKRGGIKTKKAFRVLFSVQEIELQVEWSIHLWD